MSICEVLDEIGNTSQPCLINECDMGVDRIDHPPVSSNADHISALAAAADSLSQE